MKKTALLALALCLVVTSPLYAAKRQRNVNPETKAHIEKQRGENRDFRKSIKDLSVQGKAQATIGHRKEQINENVAFTEEKHKERMTNLQEKLNKNTKLTEAEKAEILANWESRFQEMKTHRLEQHNENLETLEKIANDPNMTAEQARELLKSQKETQQQENQQFRQERREEWKNKKEDMKNQLKDRVGKPEEETEDQK